MVDEPERVLARTRALEPRGVAVGRPHAALQRRRVRVDLVGNVRLLRRVDEHEGEAAVEERAAHAAGAANGVEEGGGGDGAAEGAQLRQTRAQLHKHRERRA
eukprot:1168318-Pleurochrysis_carterae.AAC.1